jgi:signal transduction histidine kinase
MVEIEDSGIGISKENLKRVFDPFFTTKPSGRGTGLGLAVCYGIITAHGGNIEVQSQSGKGTKFTIKFPAQKEFISTQINKAQ